MKRHTASEVRFMVVSRMQNRAYFKEDLYIPLEFKPALLFYPSTAAALHLYTGTLSAPTDISCIIHNT